MSSIGILLYWHGIIFKWLDFHYAQYFSIITYTETLKIRAYVIKFYYLYGNYIIIYRYSQNTGIAVMKSLINITPILLGSDLLCA